MAQIRLNGSAGFPVEVSIIIVRGLDFSSSKSAYANFFTEVSLFFAKYFKNTGNREKIQNNSSLYFMTVKALKCPKNVPKKQEHAFYTKYSPADFIAS